MRRLGFSLLLVLFTIPLAAQTWVLHSPDLEIGGRGRLELDDKLTWYANAGIGVEILRGLSLVADGRYLDGDRRGGRSRFHPTSGIFGAAIPLLRECDQPLVGCDRGN